MRSWFLLLVLPPREISYHISWQLLPPNSLTPRIFCLECYPVVPIDKLIKKKILSYLPLNSVLWHPAILWASRIWLFYSFCHLSFGIWVYNDLLRVLDLIKILSQLQQFCIHNERLFLLSNLLIRIISVMYHLVSWT